MSQTKLEICNQAIALVKGEIILNDSELETGNSESARLCRLFYQSSKEEVLRGAEFGRSTAYATLTRDATAPLSHWTYRYSLPSKCLRVFRLNDIDPPNDMVMYWDISADDETGPWLVTDQPTAKIKYAFDQEEGRLDALCVMCITWVLASKLAFPLVGSTTLGDKYLNQWSQIARSARSVDSMEGTPEPENKRKRSKWLKSRRVSTNG